jgi:hypothetical protein
MGKPMVLITNPASDLGLKTGFKPKKSNQFKKVTISKSPKTNNFCYFGGMMLTYSKAKTTVFYRLLIERINHHSNQYKFSHSLS